MGFASFTKHYSVFVCYPLLELKMVILKLRSSSIVYTKNMKKQWMLGFLGFLGFLGIPGILTQDWKDLLWLLWLVWFLYFIPQKRS